MDKTCAAWSVRHVPKKTFQNNSVHLSPVLYRPIKGLRNELLRKCISITNVNNYILLRRERALGKYLFPFRNIQIWPYSKIVSRKIQRDNVFRFAKNTHLKLFTEKTVYISYLLLLYFIPIPLLWYGNITKI